MQGGRGERGGGGTLEYCRQAIVERLLGLIFGCMREGQ